MLRRFRAVLVAAVAGTTALVVAAPATAAVAQTAPQPPKITSVSVHPDPVIVRESGGAPVRIVVRTTGTDRVTAQLEPPSGSPVPVTVGGGKDVWEGKHVIRPTDPEGKWKLVVTAVSNSVQTLAPVQAEKLFTVVVADHTRIADFDAYPEPVDEGDTLNIRGRLDVNEPGGWGGYERQRVHVLFRPENSGSWQYVDSDVTDHAGRFHVAVDARESGWWRAEFRGNGEANGSWSRDDFVEVRPVHVPLDTRIVKYNASPEPVKRGKNLTHTGRLQIDEDYGWTGFRAQKVRLYFRTPGGRWSYVKTAATGAGGAFTIKAKAWRSGYWRVVYAGDDYADGSASWADHVKVRR
ncbi:hypothetical protein [Rhizohabitans arisaemae]|uniref:hypothetical protein n=1 Tax=Rhizohabitans arisaemae TaxID=2720610 RepID=UPI0024B20004|nr:hypothetical protein [Rhizohabitans arisaemae]